MPKLVGRSELRFGFSEKLPKYITLMSVCVCAYDNIDTSNMYRSNSLNYGNRKYSTALFRTVATLSNLMVVYQDSVQTCIRQETILFLFVLSRCKDTALQICLNHVTFIALYATIFSLCYVAIHTHLVSLHWKLRSPSTKFHSLFAAQCCIFITIRLKWKPFLLHLRWRK